MWMALIKDHDVCTGATEERKLLPVPLLESHGSCTLQWSSQDPISLFASVHAYSVLADGMPMPGFSLKSQRHKSQTY